MACLSSILHFIHYISVKLNIKLCFVICIHELVFPITNLKFVHLN